MKLLVNALSTLCVHMFSTRKTRELIQALVNKKLSQLPPKEGLTFLLELDSFFFKIIHPVAIAYNNGNHPAQRILNYKQFFIDHIEASDTVLDIGCHEGKLSKEIAEATGAKVIGVELLEDRAKAAQQINAHPLTTFYHADALTFQPLAKITTVVMSAVLEHMEPRVDILKTLVSKYQPRQILIRVPMFTRDYRVALKKELGMRYQMDSTHYIEYTNDEFEQEMADAGLTITHLHVAWGELYAVVVPAQQSCDKTTHHTPIEPATV